MPGDRGGTSPQGHAGIRRLAAGDSCDLQPGQRRGLRQPDLAGSERAGTEALHTAARLGGAPGTPLPAMRPPPPAAVSRRTQPRAPNSVARAGLGLPDRPRAAGAPGSGWLGPVRLLLGWRDWWVLRVTHAQSGGGLGASPTGWTHRGCSAPHPRGSALTSLFSGV